MTPEPEPAPTSLEPTNAGRGFRPALTARLVELWGRRPRWQRVTASSLLVLTAASSVFLAFAWERCFFHGCPDVHALVSYQAGGAPVLLDRAGHPFADLAPVEGQLARLAALPRYLPEAFIAVEDRRFRDHHGIDWRRVGGAMRADLRAKGAEEGASTLTMQLARTLFPERIPGMERTIWRKLLEMRVAREIEEEFGKDEILELYLNHVYLGDGARGVEAASQRYFGVAAAQLTLAQSALLAALPKSPTRYNPRQQPARARARRDLVLSLMEKQGRISPAEAAAARALPLSLPPRTAENADAGFAPYFVEAVRQELEEYFGSALYNQPLRVTTTLDREAQGAATEELERQLEAIEGGTLGRFEGPRYDPAAPSSGEATPYLQGAVIALDVHTGDVLAWVGGRDFRHSRFDRVMSAERQLGSAFKPFVYAAALQAGHTMAERVSDRPLSVPLGGREVWKPRNFNGAYSDAVTLRDALVYSKNVATIRLVQEIGTHRVALVAEAAGIAPPIDEQPSMALGTVAVSPLELAASYTTFATLGERATPRLVLQVKDPEGRIVWEPPVQTARVLSPGAAYIVTDVLQEVITRGTATSVRETGFKSPAAGKTGTTNDGADAWFVGYTPEVVAAVWVGFDQPRSIVPHATGGRLAAPAWARMMTRMGAGKPAPAWPAPDGVVVFLQVDEATGSVIAAGCPPAARPAHREVFLISDIPAAVCPVDVGAVATGTSGTTTDSEEQTDAGLAPLPGAEPAALPEAYEGARSYTPRQPASSGPSPAVTTAGGSPQVPSYGNQPVSRPASPEPAPLPTPTPTPEAQ